MLLQEASEIDICHLNTHAVHAMFEETVPDLKTLQSGSGGKVEFRVQGFEFEVDKDQDLELRFRYGKPSLGRCTVEALRFGDLGFRVKGLGG